ncbi:Y-family DNA polymerase [Pseudogulbenkiania sp. MAI-1]|uniref:Y-family DNA polymerase n=1 Tax=Pseudogulbenkiania sp. MAI-1 TaxID=990370 RepID=UPI00045E83C7|nr:Y-family DNA polymerase [Pseudogulbenkiania sp. MAI-1]
MTSCFAQVDCNNFYAACERVFNPALAGRPVVVLSNNDGCVVSRSAEAKRLGVPMGAPYFAIKAQLQRDGVAVFSSNYALYGDLSSRAMRLLAGYARAQEVYSIDECFLDLSGEPEPAALAQRMRDELLRGLGLPACVGLGPSKTLAKLANHLAKQDAALGGVLDLGVLDAAARLQRLAPVAVEEVWGIGRRLGERLRLTGIGTARQLAETERDWLQRRFGLVTMRIADELRGASCLALESVLEPRRSVMSTRSFGRPVKALSELQEAVSMHACRVAERLRRQRSLAHFLRVGIRAGLPGSGRGADASETVALLPPSNDSRVLARAAQQVVARLWRAGVRYHKAGAMAFELVEEGRAQADLFAGDPLDAKGARLMQAIDAINQRMGRGTVRLLAEGTTQPWRMKQDHLSPCYTTRWDDIPVVKAN